MMMLPTAKILLFIALALGPKNVETIYATSNSEGYVWTPNAGEWTLQAKGFPASDFTRDPTQDVTFNKLPGHKDVPSYLWSLSRHDWSHDSVMIFDNGDRVEKCGDHAFYIINAGAPNQKIYTILFPTDDD